MTEERTSQCAPGHVPSLQCGACEKQEVRLFVDGEWFVLKCDSCGGVGPFDMVEVPRPSPSFDEVWSDFGEVDPDGIPDHIPAVPCSHCGRPTMGLKLLQGAQTVLCGEAEGMAIPILKCYYCAALITKLGEQGYPPIERLTTMHPSKSPGSSV